MNVFYLSSGPWECAQYHCDKHVVKMVVEYAQLLSTAHRMLDADVITAEFADGLYKKTHVNHPSAVWVRSSRDHYDWLYTLFVALCVEYTWRYKRVHLTWIKLKHLLETPPVNIPDAGFTPPPQAMPDEYKNEDTIAAYRAYYLGAKSAILKFTRVPTPQWILESQ
jgi:hypothetical protein